MGETSHGYGTFFQSNKYDYEEVFSINHSLSPLCFAGWSFQQKHWNRRQHRMLCTLCR